VADQSFKPGGSFLLLDEYFAAGSDAFVGELMKVVDARKLAGLADRWKVDPRPWARQKIFEYLDKPLATPGHNVLVKRLFKEAEKRRDSELMGAFLHAFDVLVRRQRRMKWRWDSTTRQSWREEELFAPKDNLLVARKESRAPLYTNAPQYSYGAGRFRKNGRLFSYRTRYYLRRRAWRYFRFLSYRAPAEFPGAIAPALARYTDADLAKGEHILDSWCLLNVCFRKHAALEFTPSHVRLVEGHTLNELTPAPKQQAWTQPAAGEALWTLLSAAQSRLVRVWAIQLLRQHHEKFLETLPAQKLLPLFDSFDAEIQQFAAQLLEKLPGLGTLPINTWLQLLQTHDPSAQAAIAALMIRHVTADRLDLAQTISLANSKAAPVANLGLLFLRTRNFSSAAEREMLSDLCHAKCQAVAPAITQFALSILGSKANYRVELVSRFFDALLAETRRAAWAWLTPESAGYDDAALWSRLLETPYEDVRLQLVKLLEARRKLPGGAGADVESLAPIWTAVLLGIHRGGRHKVSALHQISRVLVEMPEQAERLLPVVAVAIRSVRPPEARVGLAAVVQVVERRPALAEAAGKIVPELHFVSEGATA
jgi:hypothetical protein